MNKPSPPKYLLCFFRWFCHPELHPFIEGDLLELYAERMEVSGRRKANFKFALDVLLLFRLSIIRPFKQPQSINRIAMLQHNFIISFRNFKRHRITFLINLLGLSTGLTCALLIFLWVQDELKMDKFHEKDEQLYQLMQIYPMGGKNELLEPSPAPLAQALEDEVPEVEAAISAISHPIFEGILVYEDKEGIKAIPNYADDGFFEMFSYPLIHGNKGQALSEKYNAVISKEIALKLFSSTEDAIGKSFEWKKKVGDIIDLSQSFTITGVFDKQSSQSSENFDVVFTYDVYDGLQDRPQDWNNDSAHTYLILAEDSDIDDLNSRITALVASHRDWENQFLLKQYSSKYLHGKYENGMDAGGRIAYVWMFSAIAVLILVIASINFMNLSTARASIRLKEIGIKKTLGSSRKNLAFQFVMESLLISLFSLLVAGVLITAILPQFNQITGKQLGLDFSITTLGTMLGITLLTGIVSSTYPALYLSSFNPVQVLKGNGTPGKLTVSFGEVWVRKGLVIFQFTMSIILIAAVFIVYLQMEFINNKNLGYDREHILTIKNDGDLDSHIESFLSEVRALPQVINATNSAGTLVSHDSWTGNMDWEGKDKPFIMYVFITNYDFIETFGISLKEGRSFSRAFGSETSKVVLNEAAIEGMGLEDPIGKTMTFWGETVEIIGIVEDFQYESLYNQVEPCIFRLFSGEENYGDVISIKMQAGQEKAAIANIASLFKKFNPNVPFEYGFMDDEYQALYEAENRVAVLSKYFAGLAIIISCLGLFGLATFTAERRTKEIGIRKILGSSVWGIVRLLSTDFTKMVFFAIMIALPVSYVLANNWLSDFAYRIDLAWWYFIGAALIPLFIAWLTVGLQIVKAASMNPAQSLKEE
ncbi:MAG: ABC transporter permease [Bacteroidota bacterium]